MKILIAGDFCPQYRVAEKFEHDDFKFVLREVKDIISNADYSIVNFECPVTKGGEKPIEKCGPNLQCSEKGMEAVKWVGFDCVTLANNHFLDFGKDGVVHTLEACKKYGLDTVGGGINLKEASRILYKEINGKTLAVINCCEHEFSIATDATAGSNPLNPIKQYYSIKEARANADYVIVIVHGGHEHYQLPSLRMQETYRFFIDAGADAVINHHQHCYSGYEFYKDKPIFYGLGNFCFDGKDRQNTLWNEGYMVSLNIIEKEIKTECIPYNQCGVKPIIRLLHSNSFDEIIQSINKIIQEESVLKHEVNDYYSMARSKIKKMVEPIQNKYISHLQYRHFLPSLVTKKWLTKLQNYILCESHRDKMEYYFKNNRS